jgi:hypothetical protein
MLAMPSIAPRLRLALLSVLAAAAAGGAAACAQEPRTFDNAGGSAGAGDGGGGAGGDGATSTGTAGGGGAGGEGGAPPAVCEPGLPPFGGALCGPPALPCALLADEVLPSPPSFRNDSAAIAADGYCAPHIAYSVAENGFHGFYARRDDQGAWSAEETPFPIATVAIEAAQDGTPFVLAYNGAFGASLWNLTNGQWVGGTQIPGQAITWAAGMGRDSAGVLHAAGKNSTDDVLYARYENGWTLTQIGAKTSARVPLALSDSGAPHMAFWASNMSGWHLHWAAPPAAPEVATPLGSSLLDVQHQRHAIAVTAADGQNPAGRPHLLFDRPVPNASPRQELAYATRQGAGAWNVFPLDQDKAQASYCNNSPGGPGEACDFDFEETWPIAVVASRSGDVRFLYVKHQRQGTYVSTCLPPPQDICYWTPQTDNSTGQLLVGWLDGGQQPGSAPVADGILAVAGTAALDALGRMHIAVYDTYPPSQDGTTVRYLQIGP